MSLYILPPAPDKSTKETNFAYWQDGFSEEEIQRAIEIGESLAPDDAYVGSGDGASVNYEIRSSFVSWIKNTNETEFLYRKLGWIAQQLNGEFFELDIWGFSEDIQYTKYSKNNDHYTWHMDKGFSNNSPRKLSLVLQLSDPDEYEGGELQFFVGSEPEVATKKKGLVYAFPSYIVHRVTPITAGVRRTLVVWLTGPKFK